MASENIYGGKTYINSSFVFDREYSNLQQANQLVATDGVLLGRYILIKYCNTAFDYNTRKAIELMTTAPTDTEKKAYWSAFQTDGGQISKDRVVCQKVWNSNSGYVYREIANLHSSGISDETMDTVQAEINKMIDEATEAADEVIEAAESAAQLVQTLAPVGKKDGAGEVFNDYANNRAPGNYAHAEGGSTTASGDYSHTGGLGTEATVEAQTAIGKYNAINPDALFIVGNGANQNSRQNVFEVLKDGRATILASPQDDQDVANKSYVDATVDIIAIPEKKTGDLFVNQILEQSVQGGLSGEYYEHNYNNVATFQIINPIIISRPMAATPKIETKGNKDTGLQLQAVDVQSKKYFSEGFGYATIVSESGQSAVTLPTKFTVKNDGSVSWFAGEIGYLTELVILDLKICYQIEK